MEYENISLVELTKQFRAQFDLSVSDAFYLARSVKGRLYEIRMNNELQKFREEFLAKDKSLKIRIVRAVQSDDFDLAKKLTKELEAVEAIYQTNCSTARDKYYSLTEQMEEK